MTIVLPVFFVSSASRLTSAVVSSAASPLVGSSRKRMTGSVTSSSAMFTRLRCPPESTFFSGLPIWRFLQALEPEVAQRLVDAPVDLLLRVVRRQAEARRVLHRLEHRELGVHDVVLRDVADAPAERVVDGVEVLAVDADLPARRRQVAVEREEQRRLAGARRAHQRDHVARQRLEGDVIEEHLHLRPCRRDRAPRERGPTPRSRRVGLPAQSAWSSTTMSTRLSPMWMSSGIGPMKTFSPFETGTRWPDARRCPRTNVPFALPRSSRKSCSPVLTICACFELTCGWLTTIVVVGRAADRDDARLELFERELADDRAMLARRLSAGRVRGAGGVRSGARGPARRPGPPSPAAPPSTRAPVPARRPGRRARRRPARSARATRPAPARARRRRSRSDRWASAGWAGPCGRRPRSRSSTHGRPPSCGRA